MLSKSIKNKIKKKQKIKNKTKNNKKFIYNNINYIIM